MSPLVANYNFLSVFITTFVPTFAFSFAYSCFDFEVEVQSNPLSDQLLPNASENQLRRGFQYLGLRWNGSVLYRWVDEFRQVTGVFQGNVETYSAADANASHSLTNQWSVGVNVANWLDSEHWQSFRTPRLGQRRLRVVSSN